jgi:ATP-dependent Zn protease
MATGGTDGWMVEHCITLLGRRWRLHLERAFALSDQIVRSHQPHIHALAKALTERGLIEGEEVEQIFAAQGVAP